MYPYLYAVCLDTRFAVLYIPQLFQLNFTCLCYFSSTPFLLPSKIICYFSLSYFSYLINIFLFYSYSELFNYEFLITQMISITIIQPQLFSYHYYPSLVPDQKSIPNPAVIIVTASYTSFVLQLLYLCIIFALVVSIMNTFFKKQYNRYLLNNLP